MEPKSFERTAKRCYLEGRLWAAFLFWEWSKNHSFSRRKRTFAVEGSSDLREEF
jgi:hypothetical protein